MEDHRSFVIRRPGSGAIEKYSLEVGGGAVPELLVEPYWADRPISYNLSSGEYPSHFHYWDTENLNSTESSDYTKWVSRAVRKIKTGDLEKVVTWRTKVVDHKGVNPMDLFFDLERSYPNAYVYLLSTPETGTWLGASPETLLKVKDSNVESMSLAGTRPSDQDGPWGQKEIEEQEVVTRTIQYSFIESGLTDINVKGPFTHPAGPVSHLLSLVQGILPSEVTAKELAQNLHPTPAVGGSPRKESLEWLKGEEKRGLPKWGNRQLYGGYIGIFDESGGEAFVNLRCMRVDKNKVVLFAGGGITKDSDPESEWSETERKLETLLSVIHLE